MAMTIRQKQWQLFYLGYYGNTVKDIDGIWGPNSIMATTKFQEDCGMTSNGNFGTTTEEASKNVIKTIQKAVGVTVVDGLAGNLTVFSTKSYQTKNGLSGSGRINKETLAKLGVDIKAASASTLANNPIVSTPSTGTSAGTANNTDDWSDILYFTKAEFKCKCGGKYCNGFPVQPSKELAKKADMVRKHFNAPMTVSSGIRCKTHNANVGGVYNSYHMTGKAMDFCVRGKSADQVLAYVKTIGVRYCYKINESYVHMDVY